MENTQDATIMCKYELTDYQWNQIKDLIQPKNSTCGRARRDPRELMNSIIWVLRTGALWCELPKKYGPWHTAYNNFKKMDPRENYEKFFKNFFPRRGNYGNSNRFNVC